MKNKVTKLIALLLALAMVLSLAACGAKEETVQTTEGTAAGEVQTEAQAAGEEVTDFGGAQLEMVTQLSTERGLNELKALCEKFGAMYNCTIVVTEYGTEYESIMKTRMASNEMPDILETHGWSRLRYGEYLEPVQNESWYQYENEMAKGILQGDGEEAYALMLTATAVGMIWNKTVCEENGIDVYAINTYADVIEVCQKLIDAGIVPMGSRGSNDDMADMGGIFCSYPDALSQDGEAQLDGSWDWSSYKALLEMWATLIDMGAVWEDVNTMDATATKERVAQGASAFNMAYGLNAGSTYGTINPEHEFVATPFPAVTEGANRYVACGEGYAVGVYNESKNKEAALKFLEFLSVEGGAIASVNGGFKVISTIEVDSTTAVQKMYSQLYNDFPDAVYKNLWDREYMPSGMWSVFGEVGDMMFADTSEENQLEIIEYLKNAYVEKYEAEHG